MAGYNKIFKLRQGHQLLLQDLAEIPACKGQDIIHHFIQEEQRMREMEGLTNNTANLPATGLV
jgi:hypothetical protein